MYRIIGAVLVIAGCTVIGRIKVTADKRLVLQVEEVINALNIMVCELEFHRTPLPALCFFVSEHTNGAIADYFIILYRELSSQVMPDVKSCSDIAIRKCNSHYVVINDILSRIGNSLGVFSIDGQVQQLKYIVNVTENQLLYLRSQYEKHGRATQSLWICAGIATAVILI